MKNLNFLKYALVALCIVMQFSCDTDNEESSEVYVYFPDSALNVTEDDSEATNIPIQIFTIGDLQDNLQVNYTIEGDGASRVSDESGGVVTFEKGFESYIGYISLKPINNDDGDGDTELSISLSSSNPNIIFGLGSNNDNSTLALTVIDDECTKQIDVFPGTLLNNASFGSNLPLNATLDGNVLTLEGDVIGYSSVNNPTLDITLTPSSDGAVDGTVTFEDSVVGSDSSGFDYYVEQNGVGTYDACLGEIRISLWIYYSSGGSWTYWYASDSVITIP